MEVDVGGGKDTVPTFYNFDMQVSLYSIEILTLNMGLCSTVVSCGSSLLS